MTDQTDVQPTHGGIRRRTIVKGTAWAAPVAVVASAAPAFASSGTLTLTQTGACKSPGNSCSTFNKGYRFTFNATSTFTCPVTITSATVTLTSGNAPGDLTVATPFTVPAGVTPSFLIQVNGTNSANTVFTATLCFSYTENCDGQGATPHSSCTNVAVTGTPPDCVC